MEKVLFQNIDESRRAQMIRDNADEILSDYTYMKQFDSDQLELFKNELSQIAIDLDTKNQKFKIARELYKAETKPFKERYGALLTNIRQKAESVTEQCYVIRDFDTKEIGIYNDEGILLHSRSMRPNEGQKTIQMELREGTNN